MALANVNAAAIRNIPVIAAAFALMVVFAGCTVSNDQEVAIGAQDAAQINAQLPIIDDPEIAGYVERIGNSIASKTPRADLAWHFYVVNTSDVNAFALPGGFIYVNRGLIEQADKLDELAGAIGHEIGHVVRRHAVDQMKKQTGAQIGVSLACTLTHLCDSRASQVVISAAGSALFAKYSRADEAEADSEAVVNAVNAGYDPRGIPELFRILIRERERSPSKLDAFFASHPLEEDRITATENQIRQVDPSRLDRLVVDVSSFHTFKGALVRLPVAAEREARP
jgi:predicted Zn-dependent protease